MTKKSIQLNKRCYRRDYAKHLRSNQHHRDYFFLVFISVTLYITYWAAKKTKTTKEYYAAGRSITGFQNGVALAGDYMSAASFLGISV